MLGREQVIAVALAGTLVLHGAAAVGLIMAKEPEKKKKTELTITSKPKQKLEVVVPKQRLVAWTPPRLTLPVVRPEPPKPDPVEKDVAPPLEKKPKTAAARTRPRPRVAEPPPETQTSDEEPAPGPKTDPPPPEGEGGAGNPNYTMDDLGDVVVPTGEGGSGGGSGTGTGRKHGKKGGTGDGGGGGAPDSKGTGDKPATVATVKKQPVVEGDFDNFQLEKDYPKEAREAGIGGEVLVRILVSAEGRVVKVKLKKGLGYGLDEKALDLARTIKFQPALDSNDQPVAMWITWKFTFNPPE